MSGSRHVLFSGEKIQDPDRAGAGCRGGTLVHTFHSGADFDLSQGGAKCEVSFEVGLDEGRRPEVEIVISRLYVEIGGISRGSQSAVRREEARENCRRDDGKLDLGSGLLGEE